MLPLFWKKFSLYSSVNKTTFQLRYQRYYSIQSNKKVLKFIQFGVFSNAFLQPVLTQQETWLQQKKLPSGYWKVKENQLEYMNWLSNKLNIKTMEDWYKVLYEVN